MANSVDPDQPAPIESVCSWTTLFASILNSSLLYNQGSKIALFCLYLRVPQAAGQEKILIFLVKIVFFPIHANIFCDAGQVPF